MIIYKERINEVEESKVKAKSKVDVKSKVIDEIERAMQGKSTFDFKSLVGQVSITMTDVKFADPKIKLDSFSGIFIPSEFAPQSLCNSLRESNVTALYALCIYLSGRILIGQVYGSTAGLLCPVLKILHDNGIKLASGKINDHLIDTDEIDHRIKLNLNCNIHYAEYQQAVKGSKKTRESRKAAVLSF